MTITPVEYWTWDRIAMAQEMTMIERVARAIHASLQAEPKEHVEELNGMWGTHTRIGDGWFDLNAAAKAAIEAMKEPTEEMVAAGLQNGRGEMDWLQATKLIYIGAIDAALKE